MWPGDEVCNLEVNERQFWVEGMVTLLFYSMVDLDSNSP